MKFESAFNTYQSIDQIGEGGAGIVVKVEDKENKHYALKYLKSNAISEKKLKRFKNELFFCIRNQHKNIIKIIDYGYIEFKSDKCPFYVMPLYPMTLRKLIEEGIEQSQVLPLFSQILDGIEAAHLQKVWHRDIKPENILLNINADELVFADFGVAHFEENTLRTTINTAPNERLANFQYAAPEQRQRGQKVDHHTDIYALGMILNEMFTKVIPAGTNYKKISTVNSDYGYLDSLVEKMLNNLPEDRPDSIDEIKKELIARENEFINEQKLSKLKNEVIPQSEIDDPLIIAPPKLKSFDYSNGDLVLKLDKRLNSKWVSLFHSRTSYSGISPQSFSFHDDGVYIQIHANKAQQAVDKFKEYLDWTKQCYRKQVQTEFEIEEKRKNTELQKQIMNVEERQRVLKNVKI